MFEQQHTELRKRLISIRDDPNINISQKSKLAQSLLMCNRIHFPMPSRTCADNCSLYCDHYKKNCSRFFFDCCQTIDPCHRCHLARGTCDVKPPAISSVVCNECNTRQAPSPSCTTCGTAFSLSYCDICKIWTSAEITHCDHCGFCRVGRPDSIFHCFTCEACFSVEGRDKHRCAKTKLKDALCPLCLDSVHTAQKASNILPCGHVLHTDCWREAARKGEYRCPTCRKSLADMRAVWQGIKRSISLQPIPHGFFPLRVGDTVESPYGDFLLTGQLPNGLWEGSLVGWKLATNRCSKATLHESILEKNRHVEVLCFDCESKSVTDFHFLGLECKECGSFNTCQN
eukprot:gene10805-12011_t